MAARPGCLLPGRRHHRDAYVLQRTCESVAGQKTSDRSKGFKLLPLNELFQLGTIAAISDDANFKIMTFSFQNFTASRSTGIPFYLSQAPSDLRRQCGVFEMTLIGPGSEVDPQYRDR